SAVEFLRVWVRSRTTDERRFLTADHADDTDKNLKIGACATMPAWSAFFRGPPDFGRNDRKGNSYLSNSWKCQRWPARGRHLFPVYLDERLWERDLLSPRHRVPFFCRRLCDHRALFHGKVV